MTNSIKAAAINFFAGTHFDTERSAGIAGASFERSTSVAENYFASKPEMIAEVAAYIAVQRKVAG